VIVSRHRGRVTEHLGGQTLLGWRGATGEGDLAVHDVGTPVIADLESEGVEKAAQSFVGARYRD
jgi:hypothetical protein